MELTTPLMGIAISSLVYSLYGAELRGEFLVVEDVPRFNYSQDHQPAYGLHPNYAFQLPILELGLPIYILQGQSKEELYFTQQLTATEVFPIRYEYDLRRALASLTRKEKGIVVLATFSLQTNTTTIPYRDISLKTSHYTFGICYPGFSTDYAYGQPTLTSPEGLCVNLNNLNTKGIHHFLGLNASYIKQR